MTEAVHILKMSDDLRNNEMKNAGLGGHGIDQVQNVFGGLDINSGLNPYINYGGFNDEAIKKTREYLNEFLQIQEITVSKEMRHLVKKHGISKTLFIKITDLGLNNYEEAISLFPELKHYDQRLVTELLDKVNNRN
uniref:Uncharacterized protein n=1 Tax=Strombidium rassoulzadegani TaxID=1082188 RepID=A0A7S3CMW0_9SPIT|mmetsp:Transcript_17771/g.30094  ORF Transcript_17771/g.30094 Transcript_17771/m.30094 type:complete len:136 (+) Transcript_17771:54-461(+)